MPTSKSPEEVRLGYIEKMGQDLGDLFHALSGELTWIHLRWKQYRILYGETSRRIELLNEASALFFRIIHDVFFEDTLLAIARLAGPAKSVGKLNLSIGALPPLLTDATLQSEAETLIENAKARAEFAIDWRNRRLAHRDLAIVLKQNSIALPAATREKVEESLAALRDALNHIEFFYCKSHTQYDSIPTIGDAKSLLYVIRDGLLRKRGAAARRKRGELTEQDVESAEEI